MPDDSAGFGTLLALIVFITASVWLGTVAQRAVRRGSFLKGYFLGNRGLGAWTLALTATVQSGGTFMGFPSLVYSHGWAVALWICGYMVVPITSFGVLGKRFAQLSRRTGAITVPDLFRARFDSPRVGLVSSLLILFFMSSMMIAQFKAGALVMKVAWPGSGALSLAEDSTEALDRYYYMGLTIFAITVVGYTVIGGFLAAVWTDLFQSVMMLAGVMILLPLALWGAGGLEDASLAAASHTGPEYLMPPGYPLERNFLPIGLGFSFFFVWVFAGMGSPAGLVRIMACKNTATIRRSIFLLSAYNLLIYIPLVLICICGRAMIPNLPPSMSDEIIPRMALKTTAELTGGSLLAGLILTAPFGAVMATVSSYLVVIASGIVRDIYQRFLRPNATVPEIKLLTYGGMIVVGAIAVGANIRPVTYLQAIVVFSGTSAASTFIAPALMTAYWRRATATGVICAMLSGCATVLSLYVTGAVIHGSFRAYYFQELDPLLWGLTVSLLVGIAASFLTKPPPEEVVSRLFDAPPAKEAAAEVHGVTV